MVSGANCCGCSACMEICPTGNITLSLDRKGQIIPIFGNTCIGCGLCDEVCTINEPRSEKKSVSSNEIVYGVKKKRGRDRSQSGGVFSAMAENALRSNYVIYGVKMQGKQAVYSRVTTEGEMELIRGSKYIQPKENGTLLKCMEDLSCGKHVLFSGTPCRIGALIRFLNMNGQDSSKLITVDLICRGICIQNVFSDYLDYLLGKYGDISNYNFREKCLGWHSKNESFFVKGQKYISRSFNSLFRTNECLPDSCYICPYASLNRVGDITIGDFWNIKNVDPEFDDNKGVSFVMINSEKGRSFFASIKESLDIRSYSILGAMQMGLEKHQIKPGDNNTFWEEYFDKGFYDTVINYIDVINEYPVSGE